MFDELHVQTIVRNKEIYVNVSDLIDHLNASAMAMYIEISTIKSRDEFIVNLGMVEGIRAVASLLLQGDASHKINGIETLDDLLDL
jgi:hypothetical protein